MARILVPGVTMKDVEEVRNSRPLLGNVLDSTAEDMSAPLPGGMLDSSDFSNKECQCIKILAKKLYRPYDEIYNNFLKLVPDFVKSEYPNVSDYEWVCYNFMLTEDISFMTEEEKEVARGVEKKKYAQKGGSESNSTPMREHLAASVEAYSEVSNESNSSIDKDELKDFVSRKLDGLRKEIFNYINNL